MITVYWDNPEETVVRLDYADPVATWDEYHQAVKKAYSMVNSKNTTVHVVHNPGKTKMPPGNPLMHITRALREMPPNTGLILMIVEDIMARRVLETLLRVIVRKNAGFSKSIEEAHRRIAEFSVQEQGAT